jgi:hypothetical protein
MEFKDKPVKAYAMVFAGRNAFIAVCGGIRVIVYYATTDFFYCSP